MFKKYDEHKNESFVYVTDPLKEGDAIFVKKLKVDDTTFVQLVGHISGIKGMHLAIISSKTHSLDSFGEDSLRQRVVIHQKDFHSKEEAEKHLREIGDKIKYVG
jgi:hypothetical protein